MDEKEFLQWLDQEDLLVTAKLASIAGIDGIYCTPTIALLVAPYLKKSMDLGAIKTLLLSGERVSETKRQELQKIFKNAIIQTHYALSEVGPVGSECTSEHKDTIFHKDQNFLHEVINPDTGEAVPNGEEGELVITTLKEMPTPLIRYRTGDTGILSDSLCKCDLKRETFRVIGRSGYDMVKVGGLELKAESFERGVSSVSNLVNTNEFEVHVYEEKDVKSTDSKIKPVLVFKITAKVSLAEFEKELVKDTIVQSTIIGSKFFSHSSSLPSPDRYSPFFPARRFRRKIPVSRVSVPPPRFPAGLRAPLHNPKDHSCRSSF